MFTTHRTNHAPRLVGAAVLFAGATMSVLAGPATATSSGSTEGQPEKVFVCKYVGTPDVDERLQTGNNPIEVSVNAIPIYTGQPAGELIGKEFADAQGRSIVIAVSAGPGGGQGDEPTIEDCPAPDGPPVVEPVKVTGTPTLTDPCGPGNEVLSTAPANVIFTPVDMGTFIRVTVSAAAGYTLDQAQTVFDLAVNDAACATSPAPVTAAAPTFTDPCGPDNEVLTLPVTEGVTYTQETVGNVITVTTTANAGFVLTAPATFTYTVNDAACATEDEVLGESATNNGGNNNGSNNNGSNNGANNNGGGTPDVLGEQAFADNAPAAVQASVPANTVGQVPTVINAGTAGEAPASPLAPAAIALFGALMGLVALGMRLGLARVGGFKA